MRSEALVMRGEAIIMRSEGIVMRGEAIIMPSEALAMRGEAIIMPSEALAMRGEGIIMRSEGIIQTKQFCAEQKINYQTFIGWFSREKKTSSGNFVALNVKDDA